ncbi:hypothetical protein D9M72_381010 [compost metagenome]
MQQVFAGFLVPGRGEVVVQVFKNRAGNLAGDILARQGATRAAMGGMGLDFGTLGVRTHECRMLVGIPVFIEQVVAHDEADGLLRQLVVDQDALLMVRDRACHGGDCPRGERWIETAEPELMNDLCAFGQAETTADEQWATGFGQGTRLPIGHRAVGKPLTIIGVLLLGGRLPGPLGKSTFARQVGFAGEPGRVQRHFPTEDAYLHALVGFLLEQFADTAVVAAIANEMHGRLEPPADDVDRTLGTGNGLVHCAEGLFAIDQGLVGGRPWPVLGIADEPGGAAGRLLGMPQRDGYDDLGMAGVGGPHAGSPSSRWRFSSRAA